jgi:hypothetical protein
VYDNQGRLEYIISSFGHNKLSETNAFSTDYLSLIRQLGPNCNPDKSDWDAWPGIDYSTLRDLDSADIISILKGKTKTVEGTILAEPDSVLSAEEIKVKRLLKKLLRSDVYWALHEPQIVEFTYGKYGPVTARLYNEDRSVSVYDSVGYDSLGRVAALYSGSCPDGDEYTLTKYTYDSNSHLTIRIDERHVVAERDTPELRHWETSWVKEMYAYDNLGRMVQVSQTSDDADTTYVQCRFGYK